MTIWIVWGIVLAMAAWMGYNYLRIRRAAKIVDNAEFEALIRKGQLIDVRDAAEFHRKTHSWCAQYSFKSIEVKPCSPS